MDFGALARQVSSWAGSVGAFGLALAIIVVWVVSGPIFGFSDTWQLIINTGTTIVTFLMVFLIQNTQNRDARAVHLKLDELLCSVDKARLDLIDIEDRHDSELDKFQREFAARLKQAKNERNLPH